MNACMNRPLEFWLICEGFSRDGDRRQRRAKVLLAWSFVSSLVIKFVSLIHFTASRTTGIVGLRNSVTNVSNDGRVRFSQ